MKKKHGDLEDIVGGLLYSLSAATIDRLLNPVGISYSGKGRGGTKPERLLKNQIPIKTDNWNITRPEFLEAVLRVFRVNEAFRFFIKTRAQ